MSAILILRDFRNLFGPARDQGTRQTCLAFAMSDAHAAAIGEPWVPLSCEYLFYHAKQRDGTPPTTGTTVANSRAALEHDGQPAETGWPYARSVAAATWRPPANVGTLFRRTSEVRGASFDVLWAALEEGGPALLIMSLSDAFYVPSKDGVVDSTEIDSPTVQHAVLAVGLGHQQGVRFILVRNSWGPYWGMGGHAWLSERYVSRRITVILVIR